MKLIGFDEEEKYSDLPEEDLKKIFNAIKKIAVMNDEDGLKATDNLVFQISIQSTEVLSKQITYVNQVNEDEDWEKEQREEVIQTIEEFRKEIKDFEIKFNINEDFTEYDVDNFRNQIGYFSDSFDRKYKTEFKDIISELKDQATKLADSLEEKYYLNLPSISLDKKIYGISSVDSIFESLNVTEKFLKNKKLLTDSIKDTIRKSKERIAWFRANKKISEAEISKGGNNLKRYDKLIGEAKIMLSQDWEKIFKNEEPPELN